MGHIGRLTFHHTAAMIGDARNDVDVEFEVSCDLYCFDPGDGPYAEDFSIVMVGGGELDADLVAQLVTSFDLECKATEILMETAPYASELPPGVYTRVSEQGYKERVEVVGTAKLDGKCEWYVVVRRLLRFGRDTSIGLMPIDDFRSYVTYDDEEAASRCWRRVENMPRELKVGMQVLVMDKPARIIKLGSYGGQQHATIEWLSGQEPKDDTGVVMRTMLLGPQQLANPDIITMLGDALLEEDHDAV